MKSDQDFPHCAQTVQVEDDLNLKFQNLTKHTTVTVPNNGYIVVRFLANNPGIWLFHCHTFSHLFEGQALLLDVTDQGVPPVPANFPTCPVHSPTLIDSNKLIKLDSIGNSSSSLYTICLLLLLSCLIS